MFKTVKFLQKSSQLHYSTSRYSSAFNKVVGSVEEALKDVKDGQILLAGGFGLCGIPENCISYIQNRNIRDLTVISNTCGTSDFGLGLLLQDHQIKRMISSYCGTNKLLQSQYLAGELEIEFMPQGTIAEKTRAAGAGIPAFYTPTGVGTVVEFGGFPIKFKRGTQEVEIVSEPRQRATFNGRDYLLEKALYGDIALIKAWKADTKGNLIFNKTANNMNQDFVGAAKTCIVEVEEIVEAGELDPNHIHVPGVFVSKIFQGRNYEKRIEKPMYAIDAAAETTERDAAALLREKIAMRACKEITTGMYINLGVGLPTLIPNFLPPGVEVELESENGVLGVGSYPQRGFADPDLINAGKEPITTIPGSAFFSSSQSFGIIRGRHLDMTVLGGMQVSATGDLANWVVPGKMVRGMGGAMDLVGSGSKVMVCMQHTAKGGEHKLMKECSLPLTGKGVVSLVVTEKATFEFKNGEVILKDIEPGHSLEEIRQGTGFDFKVADNILV